MESVMLPIYIYHFVSIRSSGMASALPLPLRRSPPIYCVGHYCRRFSLPLPQNTNKMKYDFIPAHCLGKPGAEEDFKEEWNALRYTVRGKMFALIGNDREGLGIISVKHTPEQGEILRNQYKEIVPGYYLNKTHWSSLYLNGNVPVDVLRQMLDASYRLVINSLTKKEQDELLGK
jgi:predicted DNA-binding protein (MmcQ/YjbR family)